MPDVEGADRLPPQSREAERSVLGSMLRDNGVIGDVLQIIASADNFYTDAHRKIFEAVKGLYDRGHPVDLVMLAEVLREQKQIEDVGGYGYLSELWDAAPTAANAEYYAKIVRDKAIVRNLIHASTEILRDSYDQVRPADELLESAERQIMEIAQKGITGQTFTLSEIVDAAYDRIDQRMQRGPTTVSGLPTGFVDLDAITAGLQDSELIIVAARPSVGKTAFSLSLIRHIVVEENQPALFVSLEQSRIELAERLLCSQARVNSHHLRKGHLSGEDMQKLIEAGDVLRRAKLFIDDSPGQGMLRIAANARRLKLREKIKVVVIDYLQLIEPENRRDSRQEQVSQISRRLKFLAKELEIPVIALAQVNRASEDRQDHRPRLADLRESGCLTGDVLVTMADTGARVPMRELVGRSGFYVWALDDVSMKLKPAEVSRAFATGRKPVFRLETRLGRRIRATGNHQFRTLTGWQRLDQLRDGDRIALPRRIPQPETTASLSEAEAALLGRLAGDGCTLPRHTMQYTTREPELAAIVVDLVRAVFGDRIQPRISPEESWYQVYLPSAARLTHGRRNPIAEWLDRLGVFGLRAYEKFVPPALFEQPEDRIAVFLRHAWGTDGCIKSPCGKSRHPAIYYATSSERLARDVQALLLRLGINGVLTRSDQGNKGRMQFHVLVMGRDDVLAFADRVQAAGTVRRAALAASREWVSCRRANTNRDVIPREVWRSLVVPVMRRNGITLRAMQKDMGMAFMGTGLYKQNVSRERMHRVAQSVGDDTHLAALAESDVYWDEVVSVVPDGEEEVFDLTVPGPANFVANDIIVHNSIEQDADTVMILHRPEMHEPGQHEGVVEVIIAKQRNGPTGEITLTYVKQFMRYENYAVGMPPFDS
ncbi:MAG TPA: replicative DNA helicase [Gemmataceae bacterium]|nr:replicative DNA helicase [Gemmataceae bacterium]